VTKYGDGLGWTQCDHVWLKRAAAMVDAGLVQNAPVTVKPQVFRELAHAFVIDGQANGAVGVKHRIATHQCRDIEERRGNEALRGTPVGPQIVRNHVVNRAAGPAADRYRYVKQPEPAIRRLTQDWIAELADHPVDCLFGL